jgi:Flp pilus assembly pilin Flp
MKKILNFLKDERGTESAEWALILGIIVIAAVGAAVGAKASIKTIFTSLTSDLATAATP